MSYLHTCYIKKYKLTYIVCLEICIASSTILPASNIAGCVVVDCVVDTTNTTCDNTISLFTPIGVPFIFFLFVFVLITQSGASVGLMRMVLLLDRMD